MNTAPYQGNDVFRGYGRGETHLLPYSFEKSLSTLLLHLVVRSKRTSEKIISSTKLLSTVKED